MSHMKDMKFQFHKGTIKTRPRKDEERADNPFQFHKGTIKTFRAGDYQASFADFNSIKVQLKL